MYGINASQGIYGMHRHDAYIEDTRHIGYMMDISEVYDWYRLGRGFVYDTYRIGIGSV